MRLILVAVVAGLSCLLAPIASADNVSAKRIYDKIPNYPASCVPAAGEEDKIHKVTVVYTVSKDGEPEDVRVRETTDECFNDTAVATVLTWRFKPSTFNGKAMAQEGVETTFIFRYDETTQEGDHDAQPWVRIQESYPERCMGGASGRESVTVRFDVTPEGTTANLEIVESSNACFNQTVIKSVEQWIYIPKTENGKPVVREGVETTITYVLENGRLNDFQIRPAVHTMLGRAQRRIQDGEYEEALKELEKLEEKYGSDFTPTETEVFHQLRGSARLGLKDYAGALDDLRIAHSITQREESAAAISETITKLEAYVAAQQAQKKASGEAGAEPDTEKQASGQAQE